MCARIVILAVLALSGTLFTTVPVSASGDQTESFVIPVTDSRTGDGPCGFEI